MSVDTAVSMRNVDVLFGSSAQQVKALVELDAGDTRDDILKSTGVVLGVADASLDVPVGSISVLMGLSGSGKSSLLRCVNGLNTVTRGVLEVRTEGGMVNVAQCHGRALRSLRRTSLAMVFQQFALLPWATVRENIGFGLSVRGENESVIKQSVDEQLELVGLQAWADKPIHTLSGGMQQRVGLARAFATDADILLMDEPFSALDPLIREHLQDELLMLQSRLQKTILFVSHDLDEALKLGNQISIMDAGRIVQTGTADDIIFAPENDYVKRFVANINPLSVLSAKVIMQPVALYGETFKKTLGGPAGNVFTHDSSGIVLELDSGRPVQLHCDGKKETASLVAIEDIEQAEGSAENVYVCVALGTPVKQLLSLARDFPTPQIVIDGEGVLCGIIEHSDLFAALSGGS